MRKLQLLGSALIAGSSSLACEQAKARSRKQVVAAESKQASSKRNQKGRQRKIIVYTIGLAERAQQRPRPASRVSCYKLQSTSITAHNPNINNCTLQKQKYRQNTNINPLISQANYSMVYPLLEKGPLQIWNANM